jgi:hypothetical protein
MASTEKLDQLIAAKQAEITVLETIKVDIAAEVSAAYNEGFAVGGGSIANDGIYTEAEYQAAILTTAEPLNAQIAQLAAAIETIPAQIEAAVEAFKAEMLTKLNEQQASESASEIAYADLLKPKV